jgi:hypothetical protein
MNTYISLALVAAVAFVVATPVLAERMPRKVDLTCMRNAVAKRETSIIAAKEKSFAALDAAFKARKTALVAAWEKTEAKDRRQAINDAWKAFRMSHKEARAQLRTDDKAAWSTFKADAKACKVDAASSETERMGEKFDAATL